MTVRRTPSTSKITGSNRKNVSGRKGADLEVGKAMTKRKTIMGKKGGQRDFTGINDVPSTNLEPKVSEKDVDGTQTGTQIGMSGQLPPTRRKLLLTTKKSHDCFSSDLREVPSAPEPKSLEAVGMGALVKKLIEYKWYHGVMPRDEINSMLLVDGDFLVRKTTEKNKPFICLSVKHGNDCRHFPLLYENRVWFVKNLVSNRSFVELVELLDYLIAEKQPLGESNAILVKPVARPDYYILNEDITLICKLGSGAFGEVWKGTLRRSESGTRISVDVAVKKMKGNPTKAVTMEFVKEAKLMRPLRHKNIVRVFGVAPNEEPLMIILELAANGCMKNYIQKNQCQTDQLMQFASDAARGMAYLSSKLIIHRDLAARNLLLGAKVEVKISDFGLSEAGKREVKVNKMKLPIRWLAPETIDTGIFTTKTDVWSFGVTLWEIFGRCSTDPFPGLTNQQAKDRIRKINPPMQAPHETPSVVVRMLLDCFEKNPDLRPTFQQILKKFCPTEDVTVYDVEEQHTQSKSDSLTGTKSKSRADPKIKLGPQDAMSGKNKAAKPLLKQINEDSTRVLKLPPLVPLPASGGPAPVPAPGAVTPVTDEQKTQPVSHSLAPRQDMFMNCVNVPPSHPNRAPTPVGLKKSNAKLK